MRLEFSGPWPYQDSKLSPKHVLRVPGEGRAKDSKASLSQERQKPYDLVYAAIWPYKYVYIYRERERETKLTRKYVVNLVNEYSACKAH